MQSVNLKLKSLNRPPKGYAKPAWIAAIVFACFVGIYYSSYNQALEFHIMQKTNFSVRSKLNKSPTLDPRLKIIVLDDKGVNTLKSHVLTFDQLKTLLQGIGAQNVKSIVIDKAFRLLDASPEEMYDLKKDLPFGVPVYTASFFKDTKTNSTKTLDTHHGDLSLDKIPGNQIAKWIPTALHRYGAREEIKDVFSGIGHINATSYGKIQPLFKLSSGVLSPHLGIIGAEDLHLIEKGFKLGNTIIHVDQEGRIPLNVLPTEVFLKQTSRLTSHLSRINREKSLKNINPGDTVLIIPHFYTGNSDFLPTPLGTIHGGFLIASTINSVLSNNWINTYEIGLLLIFLACLATLALSNFPIIISVIFSCILLPSGFITTGLYLFSFHNIAIPWFLPASSSFFAGMGIFFLQSRTMAEQSKRIKIALGNAIPPERLEEFINNPESFNLKASNQLLTTMFIDMVGFSLAAKKQTPEELFDGLKEFVTMARHIIHKHSGIVDKTLGDGLLCFFGYSFAKENLYNTEHANKALACAVEIQQENVKLCKKLFEKNKSAHLLRIGINSSMVYIGDLGDEHQVEFTLIGDGVNFAARLEQACEANKILISGSTKDLITNHEFLDRLRQRFISIKHHTEVLEAHELDPSYKDEETFKEAINAYKNFAGHERLEARWDIPKNKIVRVDFQIGQGCIADFSMNGLSILSSQFYSKDVKLEIHIKDFPEHSLNLLKNHEIMPIQAEIRWGRADGQQFLHGLHIKNLNEEQKGILLNELRALIRSHSLT